MKKIYILQMHSYTIPARAIKMITRYNYSHIGLSLDKRCDTIYSFGRRKLNNFFDSGFIVENKSGKFFHKFNKTKCCIYELEIEDWKYDNLKIQLKYMVENKETYNYDYIGMILHLFKIPVSFKNRYVCSQFVASLLENNDIYDFHKKICFVRPSDFDNINNSKKIYTGEYLKYSYETA